MGKLKRGDIFFADLGHKRRPYLVVQNDIGNTFSPRTIVVPLTSRIKKALPTHCLICWGSIKPSVVQCEEIMYVDVDETWTAKEHLPPEIMSHVDKALAVAVGLGVIE